MCIYKWYHEIPITLIRENINLATLFGFWVSGWFRPPLKFRIRIRKRLFDRFTMRRQWLYTQAMFCICKISQDWMQRYLLAKHSKSLDDIAMEKHSRNLWCFVAPHPQYCQYIFTFPDVSKNFFPLRVVQLVHTAECRHNAEEYKPQIVCRTVVIDTKYEIKFLTHKRHPIYRPWGRAMVCLLWECLEKTDRAVMASHCIVS